MIKNLRYGFLSLRSLWLGSKGCPQRSSAVIVKEGLSSWYSSSGLLVATEQVLLAGQTKGSFSRPAACRGLTVLLSPGGLCPHAGCPHVTPRKLPEAPGSHPPSQKWQWECILLFPFIPNERLRSEFCGLSWPGLGHGCILEPTPTATGSPGEVGVHCMVALSCSYLSCRKISYLFLGQLTGSASCGRGVWPSPLTVDSVYDWLWSVACEQM